MEWKEKEKVRENICHWLSPEKQGAITYCYSKVNVS